MLCKRFYYNSHTKLGRHEFNPFIINTVSFPREISGENENHNIFSWVF